MIKNYLKTAIRGLAKNQSSSLINVFGLGMGMAVAMLIGMWIWDELSYDKGTENYAHIAQVWQHVTFDQEKVSYQVVPVPLSAELRSNYPDFAAVSTSSFTRDAILATDQRQLTGMGNYVEPEFTDMMTLKMLAGTRAGLEDVNSILLSESLAKALFGTKDPMHEILRINNNQRIEVRGIYEDFPDNSSFKDIQFLAPWNLLVTTDPIVKNARDNWGENSHQLFVQLREGADMTAVSAKIKDIRMNMDNPPSYRPEFFLHPMSKWHLYGSFSNGVNTGGLIVFVWLFGVIGVFVLILACINFMNLSTARSEKRAKEVGIRKTMGSMRGQLIWQFFSESILVATLSFVVALVMVQSLLPFFNGIAGKKITVLWENPWFWALGLGFTLITGLIAGSYPAFYLSSFQPVKVLKGTFKAGRFAAVPRKVLVVFQFTVSITLIIGTLIVFRQIQFAKDRATGYDRNGLIEVVKKTPELYTHYEALRNDLLQTGAVEVIAQSYGSVTEQFGGVTNLSWPGKADDYKPLLMANKVTPEFGDAVKWELTAGRDFAVGRAADSSSMVLNESAVQLMGLENPIGTMLQWGKTYQVIGTIKNMIRESPFESAEPAFFILDDGVVNVINIRLSEELGTREALDEVEKVFRKHNPATPFEYRFIDEAYARKFEFEERIGALSAFFASLAIFISCLGLFGLASFVAEQRTKEIGIRKVLGASVFTLWKMLSKDFVVLVIISCLIATPIAWYFLQDWLQDYTYRIELSWWIFAVAGLGALTITLLTISFQGVKAALANPVKSLKSE